MAAFEIYSASGTVDNTASTTWITAVTTWINVPWSCCGCNDWLMTTLETLQDEFKYRIQAYKKALFSRKDKPKLQSYKSRVGMQMKIPPSRSFKGKESRRR